MSVELGSIYSSLDLRIDKFESSVTKALQGFYKLQTDTEKASSIMDKSIYTAVSNIEKSYKLWEDANKASGKSIEDNSKKIETYKSSMKLLDDEIKKSEKILQDIGQQCGKSSKEYENYKSHVLDLKLKHSELSQELQRLSKTTETLDDKLKTLDEGYQKTNTQIVNLEKSYKLFDLTQEKTGKGIFNNSEKLNTLKSQMNLLDVEIKKHEALLKDVEKEYGKDSKEAEQYKSKVLDLKIAHVELGGELKKVERETTTLSGKFEILGAEFNKIEQKYAMFNTVGDKIQGIGNKLTMDVTLPIVGAATAATKFAMDFGSGAAKVSTIADTNKKSMSELKQGVIDLSNQAGLSTKDLNEGLYETLSAGVDTAKSVDFLGVAVKAAKGGFTDTATAVDGLTTTLNSYGLEADKAEEISNQMLICQNLGKTTFGELASAVGKVTPIAASLGITTNELFSSLASTTAQGLATSESVTALKAAMSNIIKPSKEAREAADALGISFNVSTLQSKGWIGFLKDVKEGLKNASPEFAQLDEKLTKTCTRMNELEKAGQKGSKEYKELIKQNKALSKELELLAQANDSTIGGFATMFGSVEGLNSILMLTSDNGMNLYNESMRQMTENTGALDDAYNKMSETTETKFARALNKGKNSLMELGVKALPLFEKGIDFLSSLVDKFNALSPSTQEWMLKIGLASAALGPFLSLTGGAIKGVGELIKLGPKISTFFGLFKGASAVATAATAVEGVGTAATVATGAATGGGILGLGASLGGLAVAAAPWILAAGGVAAAGYGIYKVMTKDAIPAVDLFADKVEQTSEIVTNSYGYMGTEIETTTTKIGESTKKAVGAYMELDKKASKSLTDLRVSSTKSADDVKKAMVDKFQQTSRLCTDVSKEMKDKIEKEFTSIHQDSKGITEKMKNDMVAKMKQLLDNSTMLSKEQKNKIIAEYTALYSNSGVITETWKNDMINKYNTMGQQIKDGLKTKEDDQLKNLQDFFFNSNALTTEEETKILTTVKSSWEGRKGVIDLYTKEINGIIAQASEEHRTLREDEFTRIEELQNKMREESVKSLSASEVESKVIMERIKDYGTRITAEQARDIIKNAESQRVESVDKANRQFIETKAMFENMRDVTHELTADQADKLIEQAELQKKESIEKANELKEGVVGKLKEMTPDIEKEVDLQTGKIRGIWSRFSNWWDNLWFGKKTMEVETKYVTSSNSYGPAQRPEMAYMDDRIGYATGTENATPGLHEIAEDGFEIVTSRQYRLFNGGEKVFNHEKSKELLKALTDSSTSENIAKEAMAEAKEKISITPKVNVEESTIKNKNSLILSSGSDNEQQYEEYMDFIDKLNQDEVKKSKELLEKEYKDRVFNLDLEIRAVRKTSKEKAKELENSKTYLKKYHDEAIELLDKRKERIKDSLNVDENLFKDKVNQYTEAIKKLNIDTKDLSKNLANQKAAVVLQEEKIKILKDRYKELSETLGVTSDEAINTKKAFEDAETELVSMSNTIVETTKKIDKEYLDGVNKFADKIKNALKEKYTEEEKAQEESLNIQLDNLGRWKEKSIENINSVYSTQIKNVEESTNITIKALERQLDALDKEEKEHNIALKDKEDFEREAEIRKLLSMNYSKKKKEELQKELDELLKAREERKYKENIDTQKENLQQQIKNEHDKLEQTKKQLEEDKEHSLKVIADTYEAEKDSLDKKLKDLKKFYEKKLKEANLNAEAEKLIVDNNQKDIVELLESYGDQYENVGITLGDKLVQGFTGQLNNLQNIIEGVTNNIGRDIFNSIDYESMRNATAPRYTYDRPIVNNRTNTTHNTIKSLFTAEKVVLGDGKSIENLAEEFWFHIEKKLLAKGIVFND